MGLRYYHLGDTDVRHRMVGLWTEEVAHLSSSYSRGDWPYGKLLTEDGFQTFLATMPNALGAHDDDWLEQTISPPRFWLPHQLRSKPKGGFTTVDYDQPEAAHRLAMGEFNTAYVRGLASALESRGETHCVIYRAGTAVEPRAAYCTALEGSQAPISQLLQDHRANYWPVRNADARPIPSGPNCHHSIRALTAE
jgi:hypothetical protein